MQTHTFTMGFVEEFFVEPMTNPAVQGYNIVNTVIFIAILAIACYLIYRGLKKKVVFDYKFFLALIPYILFGISMRVIMHRIESGNLIIDGIMKSADPLTAGFWFFTPGIWILTFVLVGIGLIVAQGYKKLKRKRLFLFGCVVAGWPIIFNLIAFNNWAWFVGTIILIGLVSYCLCWLVDHFTKYKILKDPLNVMIVVGQGIDGIASSIAITFFSFSEQHVLSNILIDIHPALFVAVKLGIAVLIAYSLDDYLAEKPKNKDRKQLVGFIKVVIAVLGFATGLASLFKLGIV